MHLSPQWLCDTLFVTRWGYDSWGKTAAGSFLGKKKESIVTHPLSLIVFCCLSCWFKGQPPVVFISSLQVRFLRILFQLFSQVTVKCPFSPASLIFLFKIGLPSPSLALPPPPKKTHHSYSDIITTEEHFSGRHSNQLTCALRLTGVIYFTALSLLKSFNIKQEECHQLLLMLCFPSPGNAFRIRLYSPPV